MWAPAQQQAFELIKVLLTSPPILAHPNYDYPCVIQTDPSDHGLGVVPTQYINGQVRVIMCINRVLQAAEKKKSPQEKEALAILWGIQSFRTYVLGTKFTVETDHDTLQWIMRATKPARHVRWALELADFDFTVVEAEPMATPTPLAVLPSSVMMNSSPV